MAKLCTIGMRGGSKGVPGKNVRHLLGKPLMAYTIEQARDSGLFEHIVVTTDMEEIAEISRNYGAESWFLRPTEMANDKAAKLPAIKHALLEAEKHYEQKFDVVVDLDVTSPLRFVSDITNAFEQFSRENADILISATTSRKSPYFNMVEFFEGKLKLVKHENLGSIFIKPNASIRDTIATLNQTGEKCLIVVQDDRSFLGTLSDGDLRKAIYNGAGMNDSIEKIFNRDSISVVDGKYKEEEIKNLFKSNKFDLIPVINNDRIVVNFITWEEFFTDEQSKIKQVLNVPNNLIVRRQDAPKVYDMNASIYIYKRNVLLTTETNFTDNTSLYTMPEERSIDIDTELDFEIVEFLMKKRLDVN